MEQPELSGGAAVPMVSLGRVLSKEVRGSLEAVRVAQEAARVRARRETMRARIGFVLGLGAVFVAGFALAPRVARRWHARPLAAKAVAAKPVATSARPAPVSPQAIAPPAQPEVPASALAPAPGLPERKSELPGTSVASPAPVAALVKAADDGATDEVCDTGLIRRAPWRLSAKACARAFASDPTNARLALAIAHAEHAHGDPGEAASWAQRALDLDPDAAEAYVLIARADAAKGRHESARAAYRRYLDLAPRGWHQSEARAALRPAAK